MISLQYALPDDVNAVFPFQAISSLLPFLQGKGVNLADLLQSTGIDSQIDTLQSVRRALPAPVILLDASMHEVREADLSDEQKATIFAAGAYTRFSRDNESYLRIDSELASAQDVGSTDDQDAISALTGLISYLQQMRNHSVAQAVVNDIS